MACPYRFETAFIYSLTYLPSLRSYGLSSYRPQNNFSFLDDTLIESKISAEDLFKTVTNCHTKFDAQKRISLSKCQFYKSVITQSGICPLKSKAPAILALNPNNKLK